jgi:hypothetical protein
MKYKYLVTAIIATIVIISFLNYFIFYRDVPIDDKKMYKLNSDGFCKFKNVLNDNDIDLLKQKCGDSDYKFIKNYMMNNDRIKSLIYSVTSEDYKLQDYILIIKKSAVHTCHRDYNSELFNKNQKHPSYTLIVYLEDMEKCLGVIPESHKDINSYSYDFNNNFKNILCNKGDVILFNAGLIHAGTINSRDDNIRIQMKVTHKDDIEALSFYENYNKLLNQDNNLPTFIRRIHQRLSCTFSGISNLTQNGYVKENRKMNHGLDTGLFQQFYSYFFYGNKNFYNLPNAF